ncbi:MAG: Fe-S cluster assembly protein SufD [Ekhidna sp.]|nr:Fe-S cluster assembly protein SufD [Ekhidna sp.]
MIEEYNMLRSFEHLINDNPSSKEAWKMLIEIGLPHKKSEAYKFTPIAPILEKNINWSLEPKNTFDEKQLYSVKGSHFVFVNGILNENLSRTQPDVSFIIEEVREGRHDPFSLLNTSLASNELVITSGTASPIFIYHFNSTGISSPRIRIKIKSGESIQLVEKLLETNKNTFTNSFIHFEVAENAFACHTKVQNYGNSNYSHETVVADVENNGHFYNNTFSFESALTRNNLIINLNGQNCEGHMYGLFLLDKKSHIDNNTTVDHLQPNSFSNELYKGILGEKSTGVFNGKIYVRQDAQKTNAFQSNNNILLSKDATLHTKPQLEIWADDVKCSHGCTSGQLDEYAIFYLRTRGIDRNTAEAMLLHAFAKETLEQVRLETVKDEVLGLIDQKLL